MDFKKAYVKTYYPFQRISFLQNDTQVFDSQGNRLILCKYCGKIEKTKEFISYGGKKTMNTGECYECYNKRMKEKELEENGI